jgi:hypothetical protein
MHALDQMVANGERQSGPGFDLGRGRADLFPEDEAAQFVA